MLTIRQVLLLLEIIIPIHFRACHMHIASDNNKTVIGFCRVWHDLRIINIRQGNFEGKCVTSTGSLTRDAVIKWK